MVLSHDAIIGDLEKVFAWVKTLGTYDVPDVTVNQHVDDLARYLLDSTFVAENVLDTADFALAHAGNVETLMDFLVRPLSWGNLHIDIVEALHFRRASVGYYFTENNKDFRFADQAFDSFLKLFNCRAQDEYSGYAGCIELAEVGFFSDAHVIANIHFCELVLLCSRREYKDKALTILRAFTEMCAPGKPLHGSWMTDRTDVLAQLIYKL